MASDLIPRDVIFANPERTLFEVSPCGEYLSWLAPVDGVLNIWVAPLDNPAVAQAVTQVTERDLQAYWWSYLPGVLLFIQDNQGDENWRVFRCDIHTKQSRPLTPEGKYTASINSLSPDLPHVVAIQLNERDEALLDLYHVDLHGGERTLVFENPGFAQIISDRQLKPRCAVLKGNECDQVYLFNAAAEPEPWFDIALEDNLNTGPIVVKGQGEGIYLADSRGRNTTALYLYDFATRQQTLLAEHPSSDLSDYVFNRNDNTLDAVQFNYLRQETHPLNDAFAADWRYIESQAEGEWEITSRSLDNRYWSLRLGQDTQPSGFYLFDRQRRELHFVFSARPALEQYPLQPMHGEVITTRDGLNLVSYLTLPEQSPHGPVPMILLVHGGPWGRDEWGLNPYHQWLANRGYAVLSVNFRGSTGFGKAFVNAGDKQWGKKMHDDLLDAVSWAIEKGITTDEQVAIMGGSYGGYATLAGLSLTPEIFACGVDIVGPSNVITLLETIPPYWKPIKSLFDQRVGSIDTEQGRAALREISPLTHADKICRPLLIGQGANDPRVKQAESDQIVAAMQAKGIPVSYALYPDEGHGFVRPQNNQSFNALTEIFLAEHLGGRCEPLGDALQGSTLQIKAGAESLGLQDVEKEKL